LGVEMDRAGFVLCAACALWACESAVPSSRVEVTVTDSAGVEVFTAGEIPAWDEPTLQWRLILERESATADEDLSATPMIFEPQGVTRFPDGTLVVLDGAGVRLVVIDPIRDSVTARFGPSGQGPGEVW